MFRRLACFLLVFGALGLVSDHKVFAQVPQYSPPAGSPLPSQLNYFRFDGLTGLLDNYNGIVQPQQNLNYTLQTMNARQQSDSRVLQREITQLRDSEAAPTGVGAGFMNYSHYYPMRGGGGGARRPSMARQYTTR